MDNPVKPDMFSRDGHNICTRLALATTVIAAVAAAVVLTRAWTAIAHALSTGAPTTTLTVAVTWALTAMVDVGVALESTWTLAPML